MSTSSWRTTGTAVSGRAGSGWEQKTRSHCRWSRLSTSPWVRSVWKVKERFRAGWAARNSAASWGTYRLPNRRRKPRGMSPSPRALRRRVSTPSSRVPRVWCTVVRKVSPKGVRVVFRPVFSNSGTPSSPSSCRMAWLRLGWEMHSCWAARV